MKLQRPIVFLMLCLMLVGLATSIFAMQQGWRRRGYGGGRGYGGRGYDGGRNGVPMWETNEAFKQDVFTFVRVKYNGGDPWGRWATDYKASDLNFSLRLQQLTSLKVNPEPLAMELTDERIFDYPFLYMIEPGNLRFSEAEVIALRRYLENGGFLMVDDFWGPYAYQNLYLEMKRVFPKREPEELPLEHPIFNCVYKLDERPQIPSMRLWQRSGQTYERGHGGGEEVVHYQGIEDDNNRLMVLICHNTDLGDGWEREGEDRGYFEEFAVKKSYPLGINIVTYAMTH